MFTPAPAANPMNGSSVAIVVKSVTADEIVPTSAATPILQIRWLIESLLLKASVTPSPTAAPIPPLSQPRFRTFIELEMNGQTGLSSRVEVPAIAPMSLDAPWPAAHPAILAAWLTCRTAHEKQIVPARS